MSARGLNHSTVGLNPDTVPDGAPHFTRPMGVVQAEGRQEKGKQLRDLFRADVHSQPPPQEQTGPPLPPAPEQPPGPSTNAYLFLPSDKDLGSFFPLIPGRPFRLGRHTDNDLVLGDPVCSLWHAQICHIKGRWYVCDLGSVHGTFVKGRRILGRRALASNAIIGLGRTNLIFVLGHIPEAGTLGTDRWDAGTAAQVLPGGPPAHSESQCPTPWERLAAGLTLLALSLFCPPVLALCLAAIAWEAWRACRRMPEAEGRRRARVRWEQAFAQARAAARAARRDGAVLTRGQKWTVAAVVLGSVALGLLLAWWCLRV